MNPNDDKIIDDYIKNGWLVTNTETIGEIDRLRRIMNNKQIIEIL